MKTFMAKAETIQREWLIIDSMVFHRAGNNSSGGVRRAINHIFTLPLIQQQISLPDALGGRFADDPRFRRLLGYEAPPGTSTLDWRMRHTDRPERAVATNLLTISVVLAVAAALTGGAQSPALAWLGR